MVRTIIRLGAALLGGLAGACDDGPATAQSGPRLPATWSTMVHAGKAGPILVEVRGDPFRLPPGVLASQVAAVMGDAVTQRVFRFTTDPAVAIEPHIRTVILFSPRRISEDEAACAGAPPPAFAEVEGAPETIHLLAVFCSRQRALAAATGWVRKVEGADDRRFVALVHQATRELFREERL